MGSALPSFCRSTALRGHLRRSAAARARHGGRVARRGGAARRSRGDGAAQRFGRHRGVSGGRGRRHGRAVESRLQVRGVLFLSGGHAREDADDSRRRRRRGAARGGAGRHSGGHAGDFGGAGAPEPAPDDIALVLHTSGSTGTAEARAAAASQSGGIHAQHRGDLRARRRRRFVMPDAAVSRTRIDGLHHGHAADGRHGGGSGALQSPGVLAHRARLRRHLVFGGAHHASAHPHAQAQRRREAALRALVQRGAGAGPDAPHGGVLRARPCWKLTG